MAGSVISVLGVGMSIIVNMIVMFVGAFAGAQIIAACPVSVKNAFLTFYLRSLAASSGSLPLRILRSQRSR